MTSPSETTQPSHAISSLHDIPGRVAGEARDFAEEQKERGAERIGAVADAIHNTADQIGRDLPQAAGYIHEAAARIEQASAMVRERRIEDLLGMVDDFARRQPAAFFGGSVVAGFLLSRFLRSSNSRRPGAGASGTQFGRRPH